MNFGSYKFFGFKNVKNMKSNFNFNKNTFKMFNCSVNMTNKRFVSLLTNKIHYVERIKSLNNISKKGFASLSGNGLNLYSNPELSTDVEVSSTGEAMFGSGVVSPCIFSITNLNDLMLICEGII